MRRRVFIAGIGGSPAPIRIRSSASTTSRTRLMRDKNAVVDEVRGCAPVAARGRALAGSLDHLLGAGQ